MGMFDSLIIDNLEFQSKAFGNSLEIFKVGDKVLYSSLARVLSSRFHVSTVQVECLLARRNGKEVTEDGWFVIVEDGVFVGVSKERDSSVPLISYYGYLID